MKKLETHKDLTQHPVISSYIFPLTLHDPEDGGREEV